MPSARTSLTAALAAVGATCAFASPANAALSDVPTPTVTGPIQNTATSKPFLASDLDLKARGYTEQEYFLSGGAFKYSTPTGQLTSTKVLDGTNADFTYPYKTRVIVRRPIDPATFNGTTVMEWNNVTAGFDVEWNWFNDPDYLISHGYAWVGVSAQPTGINALKALPSGRYASLVVPASSTDISYDTFSQAAKAVRGQAAGRDIMGGLQTDTIVASGESQSGSRLNNYYNAIQPVADLIDSFFITVAGAPNPVAPSTTGLRSDRPQNKVMRVLSEREVTARPASPELDNGSLRRWEIAGGSHLPEVAYRNWAPSAFRDLGVQSVNCTKPPLSKVQWPYVANQALDSLVRWQKGGAAPAEAPRSTYTTPAAGAPIERNADGIGQGAIRLPAVDVPVSTESSVNSFVAPTGFSLFCNLLGSSTPFAEAKLNGLYTDFGDYIDQVDVKADSLSGTGFIDAGGIQKLKDDARKFTRLRPTAPALAAPTEAVNRGSFALNWRGADPARTDTTYGLERLSAAPGATWESVPGVGALRSLGTAFTTGAPAPEGTYSFRLQGTTNTEATPVEPSRLEVTPFSEQLDGVKVDRTAPAAPALTADRAPESADGWFKDTVTVTPTASADPALADGSAGSGIDPASVPAPTTITASGEQDATIADLAGNVSLVASRSLLVDADAPFATLACPSGVFVGDPESAGAFAFDGESGLAQAAPASVPVDTSTPGVKTSTITVADKVGHTATATCETRVRPLPATGPAGPQGTPGPQGGSGAKGAKGAKGARGTTRHSVEKLTCKASSGRRSISCRLVLTRKGTAKAMLIRGTRSLGSRSTKTGRVLTLRTRQVTKRPGLYSVLVTVEGATQRVTVRV